MSDTALSLLLAVFLLAANAFFVAAEFALVKTRGFRIDALAEEGRFGAELTQHILQQRRALSRLLPARHHHGLARPRLGRRADRGGPPRAGAVAALGMPESGAPLHRLHRRLPGLLLAPHRHRRAGAEDPGDPRAGAGVAVDRLSRSTSSTWSSSRSTGCSTAPRASILRLLGVQRGLAPGDPHRRRDRGAGRGLGRARQDGGEPGRVHPQPLPLRRARGRRT